MALPLIIVAIVLMLFGGSTFSLGAKGFTDEGIPLGMGTGRRLSGRYGKVVGVLLVWLGIFAFGATATVLLSL